MNRWSRSTVFARGLLLGGVLGGCYAPNVKQDVPCGPAGECPGAQQCDVDGLCRDELLPIDAPPDTPDTDNDGLADAIDNCPLVANVQQYDEDADGVGNVCDNCPSTPNPAQASTTDVDDAGDACDGSPTTRETLIVFEGFDDKPGDWTLGPGWKIMGGRLVGTFDNGVGYAIWDVPVAPNVVVATAGEMTPGSGATGPPNVSVLLRYASVDEFYRCSVTPTRGDIGRHQNATFTTLDTMDVPMPDLSKISIGLLVLGTDIGCFFRAGVPSYSLTAADPAPLTTGSKVGIRTREAIGRFDFFVAYRVDPM